MYADKDGAGVIKHFDRKKVRGMGQENRQFSFQTCIQGRENQVEHTDCKSQPHKGRGTLRSTPSGTLRTEREKKKKW